MTRLQLPQSAMPALAAGPAIAREEPAPGGFLQRPFVQNFLPFLTSLSVHAAILVVGLLAYTAITISHQPHQEQITPNDFTLETDRGLPGAPLINFDASMLRASQDQEKVDTSEASASFKHGALTDLNPAGGGSPGDNAQVISVGLMNAFGQGQKTGPGSGPAVGDGSGDGPASPFGIPQQGGPRGLFIERGPIAHRIAFVCDASGSMINKMASLKLELQKAVNALKPVQNFSIVFFQDNVHPDLLDSTLIPATAGNKRRAGVFLEGITSNSTTNPIPGIEAAFRQQPELIFLLTDGDFPDNQIVLTRIRELNKGKKVRINTIAFVGASDNDTAFIELLKTVASENGGTFRHVSEDQLDP